MDHLPWAKTKTSHLPSPPSHANSARHSVRHQFTQAFLLITGSLPAKHLINKGFSSAHILGPSVRVRRCTGGDGGFLSQIREALAVQSARLPCEARIWNPCGIPWSCDSEPLRFLSTRASCAKQV